MRPRLKVWNVIACPAVRIRLIYSVPFVLVTNMRYLYSRHKLQFYRVQVTKCSRREGAQLSIPKHVIPEELYGYTFKMISISRLISSNSSRVNQTDVYKFTTVNIYFKEISCIKYRRDIIMTWDSLIGKASILK